MPSEGSDAADKAKPADPEDSPGAAYLVARNDLVYRLSELIWGSLLASYVLGFVGFGAATVYTYYRLIDVNAVLSAAMEKGVPLEAIQGIREALVAYNNDPLSWASSVATARFVTHLCISVCFILLAAGLYHVYHLVILARPTIPLERIRWDFAIACGQAIFFGLSMLFPRFFPFIVGIILCCAWYRHRTEHETFLNQLYPKVSGGRLKVAEKPRFRRELEAKMIPPKTTRAEKKDFPLAPWVPNSWTMLIAFGGTVFGLVWGLSNENLQSWVCQLFSINPRTPPEIGIAVMSILVAVGIISWQWVLLGDIPNRVSTKGLGDLDKAYADVLDWAGRWAAPAPSTQKKT